jgi:hypothetical protein
MRGRGGYTLVELVSVIGIAFLVVAMVGPLYFALSRAMEVEAARGELLAGAREVLHPMKAEVREAESLTVSPRRLSLTVKGRRVEYVSVRGGVSRRADGGSRVLGAEGIAVEFRPLRARGVEVVLHGTRTVRSRTITIARDAAVARRVP